MSATVDLAAPNAPDTAGERRTDRGFRIALVGVPNAGKTALFNALTGALARPSFRSTVTPA